MVEIQRQHEQFMTMALELAAHATEHQDVPVGCVIVRNGEVIGKGANQVQLTGVPTQHAEIVAIEQATQNVGDKFLTDCTLYVTLEPCAMCAGAIVLSRIPTVVYAAADSKTGAVRSVFELLESSELNHTCTVRTGIMADESSAMLKSFFEAQRDSVARTSEPLGSNKEHVVPKDGSSGGTLYIVPTPIGNLEDVTLRALRVLRECDVIVCEDTRSTGRLLQHLGIVPKRLMSSHDHNEKERAPQIVGLLQSGKNCALVSDAGMPTISDPGFRVVAECRASSCNVVALSGGTAAITAVAASGLPTNKILFAGFPPQKKGRATFLASVLMPSTTTVMYESPYRIQKLVDEIVTAVGRNAQVVVARELTKKFEEYISGTAHEVAEQLRNRSSLKGEFVVMVYYQPEMAP